MPKPRKERRFRAYFWAIHVSGKAGPSHYLGALCPALRRSRQRPPIPGTARKDRRGPGNDGALVAVRMYCRAIGIKTDKTCFHSARHLMPDLESRPHERAGDRHVSTVVLIAAPRRAGRP